MAKSNKLAKDARAIKAVVMNNIRAEVEKLRQQAISETIHDLTAAFIISIHDEFGFGRQRMARVLNRVDGQFTAILEDRITIDDIKAWCKEAGFEYEEVFKNGR